MKQLRWLSVIGLLLTVGGEALRKASMFTAGRNFNHYVQHTKHHDHRLVTEGVYSFFRHPSYVGWFFWSIGTQVRFHLQTDLSLRKSTSFAITPPMLAFCTSLVAHRQVLSVSPSFSYFGQLGPMVGCRLFSK